MKIKEVSAGVKISKNYDSYQVNLVADLDEGENEADVGEMLIEKATDVIKKKLKTDGRELEEVGAAWFSRGSDEKLSVQYSKGGKFEEVDVATLENFDDGYKQKVGEDVYIFKKVLERKNNKMPVFRIYREVKNESV